MPLLFCKSTNFLYRNSVRYLRYLRKEYLGEYLPQVDDKHLKAHRTNKFTKYSQIDKIEQFETSTEIPNPEISKLYPELFPYLPLVHLRDSLRERLELREMMKRRKHLDIPEFYAGSIMAVTISDQFTPNKTNRFVGICIYKQILGLLSTVRLRNVIDNIGIEVEYDIYNPTVLKIETLKLERRLDNNLFYLRDALPEYSTVPLDMLPVPRTPGAPVPLNDLKIKMNPRPWSMDWHHHNYHGMDESAWGNEQENRLKHVQDSRTRIDRYDLMKIYRERGPIGDRHMSMRHVEILHHEIIDFQEKRYKEDLAKMKRERG